MKTKNLLLLILIIPLAILSCAKDEHKSTLEDFCLVKPNGWDCEIIQENFDSNDYPKNATEPVAIIKYKNQSCEFTWISETLINPSLILDVYPITQKQELIGFIKSQQMYSWCIPIYYGETNDYFIITSPCFINSGSFTEDANSCINDLHSALKRIIQKKEYDLIGIKNRSYDKL